METSTPIHTTTNPQNNTSNPATPALSHLQTFLPTHNNHNNNITINNNIHNLNNNIHSLTSNIHNLSNNNNNNIHDLNSNIHNLNYSTQQFVCPSLAGPSSESCPEDVLLAVEVVTIVLALGGFLGNGLTVVAIMTSRLSSSINGVLVGHLSLASLLYCCLVLPLQALAFHHRRWVLPSQVCVTAAALRVWLIGVTMCLLSAIAVYRFIHVVYPHSYRKWSERGVFYPILVFCWAFALPFCLGPVWGWGSYRFEASILQCTFNSLHPDRTHKVTVITLGYIFPCVFICVCYARIGCVVCRSRRRAHRGSIHGRQKRRRGSLRLTAMMSLIFLGFFLGTTPYFTINVLDPRHQRPLAHVWGPCAAWLLYVLNPLIYTLMDPNFQMAYRQLLCCTVCSEGDSLRHVNSLRSQQSSR
ncbi:hypothetical protein ACOMHN_039415 [Nucella lapillus]